ncbi:MAG: ABC transporter substrate-binding protein, partial [Chloroflexota bacterium]
MNQLTLATKTRWWWAAAALMALAAMGCGRANQPAPGGSPSAPLTAPAVTDEKPQPGGIFKYYNRDDPQGGFEPHIPGGRRDARRLHGMVDEYTVVAANETEYCQQILVPSLAEKWRFVNDTTLQLDIRKGVKFQNRPPVNGRELTAEDVVWSYKRLFDRGELKNMGKAITSMEATDKNTVVIKLQEAMPTIGYEFLSYRSAVIIPKEAGGASGDFSKPETLIGTGPFILKSYTPGVKAIYEKNPDYWKPGKPYVDGVEIAVMRDDATRAAALRTGQLDFLDEVTAGEKANFSQANPNLQWIKCEASSPYGIYMRNDKEPFNNVNVRRALSMSIDREAIVKGILKGEGNVSALSPFYVKGALKPADLPANIRNWVQYNPTEAKKLLAEAGYPNGLSLALEGTLAYGSPYNEMLQVLPVMMKTGGFDVSLKVVEQAEHQSTHTVGVYDKLSASKMAYLEPIDTNPLSNLRSGQN